MVYTYDDYLPSPKELDVPQELNVTSAVMRAAAHQMGKYCDNESKEFMLCRQEEQDPRKCLKEGKAVTACGVDFLMKMKQHCHKQFTDYWQCVDYRGEGKFKMHKCRALQTTYDGCVKDTLGQERVHYGYFGKIRVHETCRPKPTDIPIKHAPLPAEVPTEWNCEDIQIAKEVYEGQMWTDKIKPMIDDATKDFPTEERPMWFRPPKQSESRPTRVDVNTETGEAVIRPRYSTIKNTPFENIYGQKQERIYTSDGGITEASDAY